MSLDSASRAPSRRTGVLRSNLARGGAPVLVASTVSMLLPLVGSYFLSAPEYATWALVATVITAGIVLDLGGSQYVLARGYGTVPRRDEVRWAMIVSVGGSLLITSLAIAVWPVLSRQAEVSMTAAQGVAAILVAGLGAATRSVVMVQVSRLQLQRRFAARGAALLSQALSQVVIALLLLLAGVGVWSLPLSLLLSAAPVALVLSRAVRSRTDGAAAEGGGRAWSPPADIWPFIRSRTAVTLLGLLLTQLDRWAVGAVASADFLQAYDIAARIALLPKIVVLAFVAGLVPEARGVTPERFRAYRNRALSLTALTVVATSVALALAIALAVGLDLLRPTDTFLLLLGAMLVWHGVNTLTAPVTLLWIGSGHPGRELLYLLPCVATTAVGWAVAGAAGSELGMAAALGGSLVLWSTVFILLPGSPTHER